MPGQRFPVLDWPYVEGLRMDEAMHPLTLLAVGLYGEVLPGQAAATRVEIFESRHVLQALPVPGDYTDTGGPPRGHLRRPAALEPNGIDCRT